MIKVNATCWSEENGYDEKIYKLDNTKMIKVIIDNEIYATQQCEFKNITDDWNNDDDVYTMFGAYFKIDGRNNFLTPENIISMVINENAIIEY